MILRKARQSPTSARYARYFKVAIATASSNHCQYAVEAFPPQGPDFDCSFVQVIYYNSKGIRDSEVSFCW